MATIPSNKAIRNSSLKKDIQEQNIKTLNQLALRPNITIKKKVFLKNYVFTKKNDSQNKTTNSRNHKVEEKKETKSSKNMGVKEKVGLIQKLLLMKNSEFYPERCKRNVQTKKIKLQPKHDYEVVATTNKRKRGIPHREVNSIQTSPLECSAQQTPAEELSLGSLVRLAEDQGLDDEDFMEILTCPSPVWWEDNTDSEEDISFHEDFDGDTMQENTNKTHTGKKTTTDANGNKIAVENNKTIESDNNCFKKFVTKRSKLENILGNIKNKKPKSENCNINKRHTTNIEQNIHDIKSNIKNIEQNMNNIEEHTNYVEKLINNNEVNLNYTGENVNIIEESKINNEFRNRTRNNSSGALSDISFNEEELLNTLENIELPVKGINEEVNIKNETFNDIIMMEIRNKPIKNNEMNVSNKRKRTRKPKINNELKLKRKRFTVKKNNDIATNALANKTNTDTVPTDLPPLTKNPFKNISKAYESPKSVESFNSETTSVIELDSISDTNIKFLDEYVDEKKETPEAVSVKKYEKDKDSELVTVYQIMTNKADDAELDIEQQIKVNLVNKSPQTNIGANKSNSEINSFFKTRKNASRSRSKYKKK